MKVDDMFKKLKVFLSGVSLGIVAVLLFLPLKNYWTIRNDFNALYRQPFDYRAQEAVDRFSNTHEGLEVLLSMFGYNKDGIPAHPETKLYTLRKIEDSEYFNISFALETAACSYTDLEVRNEAVEICDHFIKKNAASVLFILLRDLGSENDKVLFDRKVELISKYMFIDDKELAGKSTEEVVELLNQRYENFRVKYVVEPNPVYSPS